MKLIEIDLAEPDVTQPLGSAGRQWLCRDIYGTLHATYNKHFDTGNAWRIMHAWSTDNGDTWSIEEVFSWAAGTCMDGCIAADSLGNVYILFEARDGSTRYLKSARLTGAFWTVEDVCSWTAYGSGFYASPCIAIDSLNTIHCVFGTRTASSSYQLLHVRYFAASWLLPTIITSGNSRYHQIAMTLDGSDVLHLVERTSASNDLYYWYYNGVWNSGGVIGSDYTIDQVVCEAGGDLVVISSSSTVLSCIRKPSGSGWNPRETIISAPSYISGFATLAVSGIVVPALLQTEYPVPSEFDVQTFRRDGGWSGSVLEHYLGDVEWSWGRALYSLYPGDYGKVQADEIMALFEGYKQDPVWDYGIWYLQFVGVFAPPVTGIKEANISNRLVAMRAI